MRIAALLLLVIPGIAAADIFAGSDSFDGSESTMSPRFFRSGTPGDACGEFSSGDFQYRAYPFSSDGGGELTASFDPLTCGTGVFVTFHEGSFNPANICENYNYSFGSSAAFTETFSVPVNSPMVMVVSGVANAPGVVCGEYTWSIDGAGASVAEIPVLGPAGLALLAGLLGVMGFFVPALKKRRS